MLTQEDLQAIAAVIKVGVKTEVKPLGEQIEALDQKIVLLGQKIETSSTGDSNAHSQEAPVKTSNESNK